MGFGLKPKGTADTAEAASRKVVRVVGVRSIVGVRMSEY